MTQKYRGIIINGREYRFRFDLNAWAYVEEKTGKSIYDIDFNQLSMTLTKALIVGGLQWNHPAIEIKDVLNYAANVNKLKEVVDVMSLAIQDSFSIEDGDSQKKTTDNNSDLKNL